MRPTVEERFWAKVDKSGECWLWTGVTNAGGYGRFTIGYSNIMAHRWSYENAVGPIPEGLQIDHLCSVKRCVNPEHLEAVTGRVNTLRAPNAPATIHAAQTHCAHGHEFTAENTYTPSGGGRYCRTCRAEREAKRDRAICVTCLSCGATVRRGNLPRHQREACKGESQ